MLLTDDAIVYLVFSVYIGIVRSTIYLNFCENFRVVWFATIIHKEVYFNASLW